MKGSRLIRSLPPAMLAAAIAAAGCSSDDNPAPAPVATTPSPSPAPGAAPAPAPAATGVPADASTSNASMFTFLKSMVSGSDETSEPLGVDAVNSPPEDTSDSTSLGA